MKLRRAAPSNPSRGTTASRNSLHDTNGRRARSPGAVTNSAGSRTRRISAVTAATMMTAPATNAADMPNRLYSRLPPASASTLPMEPMKLMMPLALLRSLESVTSGMSATIGARDVAMTTA